METPSHQFLSALCTIGPLLQNGLVNVLKLHLLHVSLRIEPLWKSLHRTRTHDPWRTNPFQLEKYVSRNPQ